MKVGVNILNFGPGTSPEYLIRWVRFAEGTGFHSVMISDHVAITPQVQAGFPAPFYDPFLALSWIAGQSKHLELGTTVLILPYRHPLLTARLAANLDQFSEGRLILGVGIGWAEDEFRTLDIPFSQRGAISNEYLEVIKLCWNTETASYKGDFVSFERVQTGPPPVNPPGPPIWVGGSSDAALRRAARYGEGWHPYRARLNWLKSSALPKLHRYAEVEGRKTPSLCPRISLRLMDKPLPDEDRILGHGNLDQIHSDLSEIASLGASYILLDTYTGDKEQTLHPERDWALLNLLAEQVLDLHNEALR